MCFIHLLFIFHIRKWYILTTEFHTLVRLHLLASKRSGSNKRVQWIMTVDVSGAWGWKCCQLILPLVAILNTLNFWVVSIVCLSWLIVEGDMKLFLRKQRIADRQEIIVLRHFLCEGKAFEISAVKDTYTGVSKSWQHYPGYLQIIM